MLKRVLAALVMLPLLIFLYIGGLPLYVCELVMVIFALHEFYTVFQAKDIYPFKAAGYIFGLMIFLKNVLDLGEAYLLFGLLIMFFLVVIMMLMGKKNIIEASITLFGMIYVGLFFDFIILIINSDTDGYLLVWLVFLIAFGTDTFAYFCGLKFGKHKLIPTVSPKKTIEGSAGGILGSILLSVLFGLIFRLPVGELIVIGLVGSIVSQVGDLFASSIKRYCEVKDYGKIIPGHGGILDRFDSVLMVAPFLYFYLILFTGII